MTLRDESFGNLVGILYLCPMTISKELRNKSGIYQIRNILNNKSYIGSSKNLYNRGYTYLYLGKQGKIHNKHLQNSIKKYGIDSFRFEVLEFTDSLEEREQFYISTICPQYNQRTVVDRNLGIKHSDITKSKISNSVKTAFREGRKRNTIIQEHSIPINIFLENGKLLKKVETLSLAALYLQVHYQSIYYALTSKRRRVKDHIILRDNELDKISQLLVVPINKKTYSKSVKVLDLKMEEFSLFETAKEASNFIGCNNKTVKSLYLKGRIFNNRYKVLEYA